MTRNHLSKVIRRVMGLTLPEFCAKYLNTNYKAFQYRARVKRLTPNEIVLLCWVLGEPLEVLFGKEFLPLMFNQGDPEIEKQLLTIYNGADVDGKKRLLNLLGANNFSVMEFKEVKHIQIKSVPDLGETVVPVSNLVDDEDELHDTPEPTIPVVPAFKQKSEPQDDSDFYIEVQVHR